MVERHLAKVDVAGPTPVSRSSRISCVTFRAQNSLFCGNSSVVERHLAKVDVAGPTPVSRSKLKRFESNLNRFFFIHFTIMEDVNRYYLVACKPDSIFFIINKLLRL